MSNLNAYKSVTHRAITRKNRLNGYTIEVWYDEGAGGYRSYTVAVWKRGRQVFCRSSLDSYQTGITLGEDFAIGINQ